MVRARLTELEASVLGSLSVCQPCTAYVIRRLYAKSVTPTWSASAGTIYPALQRLVRRGLVRAEVSNHGRRQSRVLSLTAAGQRRLEAWLEEPLEADVLGPPMDLLRTRVGFLGVLSPAKQRRFLEGAIVLMRAEHSRVKHYFDTKPHDSEWDRLILDGLLDMQRTRARLLARGLAMLKRKAAGSRPGAVARVTLARTATRRTTTRARRRRASRNGTGS